MINDEATVQSIATYVRWEDICIVGCKEGAKHDVPAHWFASICTNTYRASHLLRHLLDQDYVEEVTSRLLLFSTCLLRLRDGDPATAVCLSHEWTATFSIAPTRF